jgi:Fe2+ or Zn2+ uptake regulation protein
LPSRTLRCEKFVKRIGLGPKKKSKMVGLDPVLKRLKQAGVRPTAVRIAILNALDINDHPSAEELIRRLNGVDSNFGRATVYQNLQRLAAAGLVRELMSEDGVQRYDGNQAPHQHLVCGDSGEIVDVAVDPETLKALKPLDPETGKPLRGWDVGEVRIVFRASRKGGRAARNSGR